MALTGKRSWCELAAATDRTKTDEIVTPLVKNETVPLETLERTLPQCSPAVRGSLESVLHGEDLSFEQALQLATAEGAALQALIAVADYLRWVMSDIRRERHVMSNSPLGRLRERLLGVPLLGALAQTAARKLRK